jgi:hypothetical protein
MKDRPPPPLPYMARVASSPQPALVGLRAPVPLPPDGDAPTGRTAWYRRWATAVVEAIALKQAAAL